MKYVYHYYARRENGGVVVQLDGILYCDNPIDSLQRYREVKAVIASPQVTVDSFGFTD